VIDCLAKRVHVPLLRKQARVREINQRIEKRTRRVDNNLLYFLGVGKRLREEIEMKTI
jgi:hypothetical protein